MNRLKIALAATGYAIVLVACSTAWAQEAPAPSKGKPAGWRGDGSGRYPDANPPLNWGRVAKSIKELSAQALKPKDDAPPAKEAAIPDGVIRNWLVLGPLPAEDKKPEDILPDAATLSPNKDDQAGGMKWQAVTLDTSCMDLCALLNIAPKDKGFAAYAHAYIYSPSGQPVAYNLLYQGQGINRVWLNGSQMYDAGKNVDIGPGARLILPLKKGWNRLMILNAKTMNTRKSWWFAGSLYGAQPEYESRGIVWMTATPTPGNSAPVIVGDRIFCTGEGGSVICINKADGKLLWIHSTTYYDFATDEERKSDPEVFKELDDLAARLKKIDESELIVPRKPPTSEKEARWGVEGSILKGMRKVNKEKYQNPAEWGCEVGATGCTPVTDGQNVFAVFGSGIVVCYDRDGNRKWVRLVDHRTVEHGYTTSPMLVDGKLIVYFGSFTVLDPKTGQVILERPHFLATKNTQYNWYAHFHGTGCVLPAGNEKVLYFLSGEFVRLSDGKSLTQDRSILKALKPENYNEIYANRIATPVVDKGVAFKIIHNTGGVVSFKLPALHDDKVEPEIIKSVPFNTDKFPYYYENFYDASPLLHEGLLYCLNDFGTLTVLDMTKGEVAYQRQLDIEVYMPYASVGALKGGASSSPTLAGKYIYIWGNQGTCVVLEPGRVFKQVAKNRVENPGYGGPPHQEVTMTDPVFENGRMYYRGENTVYCIGAK